MKDSAPIAGISIVVLGLAFCGTASDLAAQIRKREAFEERIALLAATTAVAQEIQRVGNSKEIDPQLTVALEAEMAEQVAAHASRDASRVKSKEFVTEWMTKAMGDGLAKLCTDRGVTLAAVKARQEDLAPRIDAAVTAHVDAVYGEHFRVAREKAVAVQKQNIDYHIPYPKVYEADEYLKEWETKRSALIERLLATAIPPDRHVFQECRDFGQDQAAKVANNIRLEYQHQQEELTRLLDNAQVPADRITSTAIRESAIAAMSPYFQHQDREGVPEYTEIFPSLLGTVDEKATKLESERFAAHLKTAPLAYPQEVYASQFRGQVEQNPQLHRRYSDSRDAMAEFWRVKAEDFLIKTYVGSQSESSRRELQDYFRQRLDEGKHGNMVLQRLKDLWDGMLPELRKKYADFQVAGSFPQLPTWVPAEEKVNQVYDRSYSVPDSYDEAVGVLGQVDKPAMIEEAEQQVLDAVKQRLGQYTDALAAQLGELRSMEQVEQTALKEAVVNGATKESLVSAWKDKLEARWKGRVEENRLFRDLPIFARTQAELAKTVSQYFDSIFQQEQARRDEALAKAKSAAAGGSSSDSGAAGRPSETRPDPASGSPVPAAPGGLPLTDVNGMPLSQADLGVGGGRGGGTGTGAGEAENESGRRGSPDGQGLQPDIVLTVADGEPDRCRASWEPAGQGSLSFVASESRAAADKLAASVDVAFNTVLENKLNEARNAPTDEPAAVRFHLRVTGTNFRYVTGIYLREHLERKCQERSQASGNRQQKVTLKWSDGR